MRCNDQDKPPAAAAGVNMEVFLWNIKADAVNLPWTGKWELELRCVHAGEKKQWIRVGNLSSKWVKKYLNLL